MFRVKQECIVQNSGVILLNHVIEKSRFKEKYDCVIEVINIISFFCLLTKFVRLVIWINTTRLLTRLLNMDVDIP